MNGNQTSAIPSYDFIFVQTLLFGRFTVSCGKVIFGVHIKFGQVEHDCIAEALTIAVTAGLRIDRLDLRVH